MQCSHKIAFFHYDILSVTYCFLYMHTAISKRLSEKMCTRQSPKKIWDMINTWFLTTAAVEHTFVAFLEHSQTYVRGLQCHFFKFLWRTKHPKPPTIPFGTVTCTFSDNLSWNSCIPLSFRTFSLVTKAQAWEKHTINLFVHIQL